MIILYGPTAVGKSDIAVELAQYIPAEIINLDVGQFYSPLTIGTSKPDWRNAGVPHHLFDILDSPTSHTVVAYKEQILSLISNVRSRGNIPILVGGSGFYLKSLFFTPTVASDYENSKKQQEKRLDADSYTSPWHMLHAIDPQRAAVLSPNDTYRIMRALDIWHQAGIKPSLYKPAYHNVYGNCGIAILTREKSDLYSRIQRRVHTMMSAGWMDEVAALSTEWIDFIREKKIIGYNEITKYNGIQQKTEAQYDELIDTIIRRTRHYARRQMVFWRMLTRELSEQVPDNAVSITTINLTYVPHTIYIKQLREFCTTFIAKKD